MDTLNVKYQIMATQNKAIKTNDIKVKKSSSRGWPESSLFDSYYTEV